MVVESSLCWTMITRWHGKPQHYQRRSRFSHPSIYPVYPVYPVNPFACHCKLVGRRQFPPVKALCSGSLPGNYSGNYSGILAGRAPGSISNHPAISVGWWGLLSGSFFSVVVCPIRRERGRGEERRGGILNNDSHYFQNFWFSNFTDWSMGILRNGNSKNSRKCNKIENFPNIRSQSFLFVLFHFQATKLKIMYIVVYLVIRFRFRDSGRPLFR